MVEKKRGCQIERKAAAVGSDTASLKRYLFLNLVRIRSNYKQKQRENEKTQEEKTSNNEITHCTLQSSTLTSGEAK